MTKCPHLGIGYTVDGDTFWCGQCDARCNGLVIRVEANRLGLSGQLRRSYMAKLARKCFPDATPHAA